MLRLFSVHQITYVLNMKKLHGFTMVFVKYVQFNGLSIFQQFKMLNDEIFNFINSDNELYFIIKLLKLISLKTRYCFFNYDFLLSHPTLQLVLGSACLIMSLKRPCCRNLKLGLVISSRDFVTYILALTSVWGTPCEI